ncbi:UNVERIFIED_CONTAM: hypothetical protein PYX00_010067 [Menopon gallinae]|uniref:Uncharacterized protein n=1 Tax=Menopon gallinae TaxID=328185 RepID=A0AAW2HE37_9NEOP
MQISIILLLTAGLFLLCASMCCCEPLRPNYERADVMARPTRPKVFGSPDDLKNYLEELGNFYAIAGRPRFGKRTLAPWMATYFKEDPESFRGLPITNAELLQILSSVQQNQDKK